MLDRNKIFFTNTASKKGKHIVITPVNSYMKYLSYGRIIMDSEMKPEMIETGKEEMALICVRGEANITLDGRSYSIDSYDSIYLPKGYHCSINTESKVDLIMASAPSNGEYEAVVIKYKDIVKDSFSRGDQPCKRKNLNLIPMELKAERLFVRRCEVEAGNWLWPPHKHLDGTLEEIYVYAELTPPSFVVQFAYKDEDFEKMDIANVLREGDAAAFPLNIYHNLVCSPNERMVLICLLAMHNPQERKLGVPEFQPEFESK